MMQRAAGAVISNGEWVISFFSQVLSACKTGSIFLLVDRPSYNEFPLENSQAALGATYYCCTYYCCTIIVPQRD